MHPVTVPRKARCSGLMLKMTVSESKLALLASLGKIVKKKEKKIHRVDVFKETL